MTRDILERAPVGKGTKTTRVVGQCERLCLQGDKVQGTTDVNVHVGRVGGVRSVDIGKSQEAKNRNLIRLISNLSRLKTKSTQYLSTP